MIQKLNIAFSLAFFLSGTALKAQSPGEDRKKYPVPSGIENLLFYVQRTLNTNTIIYQLNTDSKGELIEMDPIKYYYINYAHNSEVEPVSNIQKKLAYGIEIKLIDDAKKSYSFTLNSVKQRVLYLILSPKDKKYHVYCEINKKMSTLTNIFVKMDTKSIGLFKVKSIELIGKDIEKDSEVTESFEP
jgi:hypothetical protein